MLAEQITPFNNALQMPDVRSMIDMNSDAGRAMMDSIIGLQAQIIAFSRDFQLIMIVTACAIPLAIMIGSTKTTMYKQSQAPDHAAVID